MVSSRGGPQKNSPLYLPHGETGAKFLFLLESSFGQPGNQFFGVFFFGRFVLDGVFSWEMIFSWLVFCPIPSFIWVYLIAKRYYSWYTTRSISMMNVFHILENVFLRPLRYRSQNRYKSSRTHIFIFCGSWLHFKQINYFPHCMS